MREMVRGMRGECSVSILTSCVVLGLDRWAFRFKPRRVDQASAEKRIMEICEARVCYGYRRVQVLLVREVWGLNIKKFLVL